MCATRRMKEQTCALTDKRHRSPPEIIGHAVWLYFRFALSHRDVEELLAERVVILTYETVRQWCQKFGQRYANELRRRHPRPGDTWHLDEVFVSINGVQHYLWRAVDQVGTVRDILLQARRDEAAATKFLRTLLKGLADVPRVVITDTPASYGAAMRAVLPSVARRRHKGRNNRAEHAHQPTRERERRMRRYQIGGPCTALPRRVWPDRRPLPPAPSPPHRRQLPPDPRRTLRHLAGRHRHPRDGLTSGTAIPYLALVLPYLAHSL